MAQAKKHRGARITRKAEQNPAKRPGKSGRPKGTYKRYLFEETKLGFFLKYEVPEVFPAYRLVAEFADGQRLTFDGLTEQQAQDRMEAAQARHGDICWYDGVTDQHYENGKYYKLTPQPPEIIVIDLTDCPDEPEKED